MENKGIEKVVIGKNAKALLAVIDGEEKHPHFRGYLIEDNYIWGTDTKILARMPLSEIATEEIPTNIKTGADKNRIWLSFDSLKRAIGNLPKKPVLSIQDNIYINKENGKTELQTIDRNVMPVVIQEASNESGAEDWPDPKHVYDMGKDLKKFTLTLSGKTILQLAEMIKAVKEKYDDGRLILKIDTEKKQLPQAVNFRIDKRRGTVIEGCFMPLRNEEKEETQQEAQNNPVEESANTEQEQEQAGTPEQETVQATV
jgi:hypothetical protein